MGVRGPVPEREDNLARPWSRKGSDEQEAKRRQMRPVRVPRADADWHPIAKQLYESLKKSGQADFYQQSDWALAFALCDDLAHYKKSGKRSAQVAQTLYSALGNLLVTSKGPTPRTHRASGARAGRDASRGPGNRRLQAGARHLVVAPAIADLSHASIPVSDWDLLHGLVELVRPVAVCGLLAVPDVDVDVGVQDSTKAAKGGGRHAAKNAEDASVDA